MRLFKIKMNDGSWGCLQNPDNIFIVAAKSKLDAIDKVRDYDNKYKTRGKYAQYMWDVYATELDADKHSIFRIA